MKPVRETTMTAVRASARRTMGPAGGEGRASGGREVVEDGVEGTQLGWNNPSHYLPASTCRNSRARIDCKTDGTVMSR